MSFVCFLLSLRLILSFLSVVFDFSASLNDVAPLSPMLFAVDMKWNGKEWIVDGRLLCVFFCLHSTDWVSWVLCLISVIHSMTLLLCLQSHCLLMRREKVKSELLMDVFCVSSFFCINQSDWGQWVLCLISMIHSMVLLLSLQYRCLLTKRKG